MNLKKMSFKHKGLMFIIGLIFIAVLLFGTLSGYIIDLQWFGELGYTEVFFKKIFTQMKFFVPSLLIMFSVFYIYLRSINSYSTKKSGVFISEGENKWRNKIFIIVSFLLSVIFSITFVTEVWYDFLIFINKTPFGLADPIFGYDISFFVFTLPFLKKLYNFVLGIIIIFAIITFIFNAIIFLTPKKTKEDFESESINFKRVNKGAYIDILKAGGRQLSALGGIFFLTLAAGFFLKMFNLLYSPRGMAFGGGYTDIHISLPFYYVYIGLSILIGFSLLLYNKINRKVIIFGPLALILATSISG
ncbi:MAG: COG1615 family transporter, partial [Clostridiales bacterium]|nr:COG1615 family transporter [Clostridiales bacterium]